MNKVQIFFNALFGSLRTFVLDGEVYFLANDVAAALGYEKSNYSHAVSKFTSADDRKALKYADSSNLNESNIRSIWQGNDRKDKTLINESGLYCLIFGSHADNAMEFKSWLAHDVLPSIRQNGGYIAGQEELLPDQQERIARKTKRLAAEVKKLRISNAKLQSRRHQLLAKAREDKATIKKQKAEIKAVDKCADDYEAYIFQLLDEMREMSRQIPKKYPPRIKEKVPTINTAILVDKEGWVVSVN